MTEICLTCRDWTGDRSADPDGRLGECRRRCPTCTPGEPRGVWPQTADRESCGEYRWGGFATKGEPD